MKAASEILEMRQACLEFARVAAPYPAPYPAPTYNKALILAAQMKSFSLRPSMAWVVKVTSQ